MLRFLGDREVGRATPAQLRLAERTRRTFALALARQRLAPAHRHTVTTVQWDPAEGRLCVLPRMGHPPAACVSRVSVCLWVYVCVGGCMYVGVGVSVCVWVRMWVYVWVWVCGRGHSLLSGSSDGSLALYDTGSLCDDAPDSIPVVATLTKHVAVPVVATLTKHVAAPCQAQHSLSARSPQGLCVCVCVYVPVCVCVCVGGGGADWQRPAGGRAHARGGAGAVVPLGRGPVCVGRRRQDRACVGH
jgi:hypothetical protein